MTPAELLPQVYDELRKLAAAKLASEKPGHTLDATALVHEAFLKLGGERSFATRSDYLRASAQAMRRILVDRARARNAAKRGAGRRVDLESDYLVSQPRDDAVEALDDALSRLALAHPQFAELVQLRHFGGLTLAQCAEVLGVSARTAEPGGPTPAPGSPSNSRKTSDYSAAPRVASHALFITSLGTMAGLCR